MQEETEAKETKQIERHVADEFGDSLFLSQAILKRIRENNDRLSKLVTAIHDIKIVPTAAPKEEEDDWALKALQKLHEIKITGRDNSELQSDGLSRALKRLSEYRVEISNKKE